MVDHGYNSINTLCYHSSIDNKLLITFPWKHKLVLS